VYAAPNSKVKVRVTDDPIVKMEDWILAEVIWLGSG
jgi:hypothetical protein